MRAMVRHDRHLLLFLPQNMGNLWCLVRATVRHLLLFLLLVRAGQIRQPPPVLSSNKHRVSLVRATVKTRQPPPALSSPKRRASLVRATVQHISHFLLFLPLNTGHLWPGLVMHQPAPALPSPKHSHTATTLVNTACPVQGGHLK